MKYSSKKNWTSISFVLIISNLYEISTIYNWSTIFENQPIFHTDFIHFSYISNEISNKKNRTSISFAPITFNFYEISIIEIRSSIDHRNRFIWIASADFRDTRNGYLREVRERERYQGRGQSLIPRQGNTVHNKRDTHSVLSIPVYG